MIKIIFEIVWYAFSFNFVEYLLQFRSNQDTEPKLRSGMPRPIYEILGATLHLGLQTEILKRGDKGFSLNGTWLKLCSGRCIWSIRSKCRAKEEADLWPIPDALDYLESIYSSRRSEFSTNDFARFSFLLPYALTHSVGLLVAFSGIELRKPEPINTKWWSVGASEEKRRKVSHQLRKNP